MDSFLEDEAMCLSKLHDMLKQSTITNTESMVLLDSLDSRLSHLETNMMGIHTKTQALTQSQSHIDQVIANTSRIMGKFQVASKEASILRQGLRSIDLNTYLQSITAVYEAYQFFRVHPQFKSSDAAMSKLKTLVDLAIHELETEFVRLLRKHAVVLDLSNYLTPQQSDTTPKSHILDSASLATSLTKRTKKTGTATPKKGTPSRSRTGTPGRGTRRRRGGGGTGGNQSARGVIKSPPMSARTASTSEDTKQLDFTYAGGWALLPDTTIATMASIAASLLLLENVSVHETYAQVRSKAMIQTLSSLHPLAQTVEPVQSMRESGEAVAFSYTTYSQGSHRFIVLLKLFVPIVSAELTLTQRIFHSHDESIAHEVFEQTLLKPMSMFVKTADAVIHTKNPVKRSFVAFDVLDNMVKLHTKVQELFQLFPAFLHQWTSLRSSLTSTARQSFGEVEYCIEADPRKTIPPTATIHEITSNTLNYLERLVDYMPVIDAIGFGARRHVSVGNNTSPTREGRAGTPLISGIFASILNALIANLNLKAKSAKHESLRHLFLLNNFHHIAHVLRESSHVLPVSDSVIFTFDKHCDTHVEDFLRAAWTSCLDHLVIKKMPAGPNDKGEYTKSAKREIKSMFSGFNTHFELTCETLRPLHVPSSEMRLRLRQRCKDYVLPLYTQLVDRYTAPAFSQNMGKYFKYSLETATEMIESLFDAHS